MESEFYLTQFGLIYTDYRAALTLKPGASARKLRTRNEDKCLSKRERERGVTVFVAAIVRRALSSPVVNWQKVGKIKQTGCHNIETSAFPQIAVRLVSTRQFRAKSPNNKPQSV